AIGYQASQGHTTASNNTGTNNVAIGDRSMLNNRSGSHNIAFGMDSARSMVSASHMIIIGRSALETPAATGTRNIVLGVFGMNGTVSTASDNICINNNACGDI